MSWLCAVCLTAWFGTTQRCPHCNDLWNVRRWEDK